MIRFDAILLRNHSTSQKKKKKKKNIILSKQILKLSCDPNVSLEDQ